MEGSTLIANMALSHLGSGLEIASLDSERSSEAKACRTFYSSALEQILREFDWPFATRIVSLGLVAENPNSEWAYSYRYPTGCAAFRRILSGIRNDSRQSRVPYRIAQDADGRLIFTDKEDAEAEYTVLEDDPTKYPPDFRMAFSLLLASFIAPRVTGGDPFRMGDKAFQKYRLALSSAMAGSANEEQPEEPPESEFIRGRD